MVACFLYADVRTDLFRDQMYKIIFVVHFMTIKRPKKVQMYTVIERPTPIYVHNYIV